MDWQKSVVKGHLNWEASFPGRGHSRIKIDPWGFYTIDVLAVRGSDGWDRLDSSLEGLCFETLGEAEDAVEAFYEDLPLYKGAVTRRY